MSAASSGDATLDPGVVAAGRSASCSVDTVRPQFAQYISPGGTSTPQLGQVITVLGPELGGRATAGPPETRSPGPPASPLLVSEDASGVLSSNLPPATKGAPRLDGVDRPEPPCALGASLCPDFTGNCAPHR